MGAAAAGRSQSLGCLVKATSEGVVSLAAATAMHGEALGLGGTGARRSIVARNLVLIHHDLDHSGRKSSSILLSCHVRERRGRRGRW